MGIWSADLRVENVRSPRKILDQAAQDLHTMNGLLVAIEESRLTDRVVLRFVAKNETSNRSLGIFEVSHGLEYSYPVRIDPPDQQLPDFLKRKRYIPVPGDSIRSTNIEGQTVVNEWICTSPSEFQKKLEELAGNSVVKARILSLVAPEIDEPAEMITRGQSLVAGCISLKRST